MKKFMRVSFFALAAALFTAGVALAGPMTAGESFKAFTVALEIFDGSLADRLGSIPDGAIDADHAIPMDPIANLEDGAYWPVTHVGEKNKKLDGEKKEWGLKEIKYDEKGGDFKITLTEEYGWKFTYEGTYDPAADALSWRFVQTRDDGGILADIYFDCRKTDFGYAAQLYDARLDAVHKLAINGANGSVGWDYDEGASREPLPANVGLDYPKTCRTWYAVSGKTLGFKPLDGEPREFEAAKK
ncbi:hypothetical protein FACS1894187_15910 [Synergistales bacterium]|nr:hypothetical protein FACS1894187_15910 [Synergistales bacterium]